MGTTAGQLVVGQGQEGRMSLINALLRRLWTGTFERKPCSHLEQMRDVEPEADVCLQCVALGDSWPRLRVCLTCGHVGCCEKAKNRHALRHFQETGHPLMRPLNMDLLHRWIWCYDDKVLLDLPRDYHRHAGVE